MYALHSQMSALDYVVEPEVECPDDDANDTAFVRATATSGAEMLSRNSQRAKCTL
jgi:hypothetical protein